MAARWGIDVMHGRTLYLLIEGRVQGVGFRAWVAQEASARGLTGWVRNRRTGAVEALLCGDPSVVANIVEACRRGPPAARVDDLYVIADVADGSLGAFVGFEVQATT